MSGGGESSNTTTTTQVLTPEQQGLVSLAYPQYQKFAASTPTMPTGDQAVAGFTDPQKQGQQSVLNAAGGMGDLVNTAANTNRYLSSGAFLDPGSNPYIQNAVKAATDPIFQNLSENTIPNQQATAASGSGINYGGSREGIAEGKAIQGAQRAASTAGANIMSDALNKGLQATGQAIAQTPASAASTALPGATQEAVGQQQQGQQQQVLNANNAAQWFQDMLPLLKAQSLTQGAAGLPGGSTTAVGQGTTNPSLMSQMIGGASAAGGLMGGGGSLLTGLALAGMI